MLSQASEGTDGVTHQPVLTEQQGKLGLFRVKAKAQQKCPEKDPAASAFPLVSGQHECKDTVTA